jgi:4-alpha-glucanotransferase
MDDLAATARRWGIEPGYHDVFGKWHQATGPAVEALAAALARGRDGPPQPAAQVEPVRAFQGDGRRRWALAVQLYSLRSERNFGIGDFGDLKRLVAVAAGEGAGAIALNPLHALFPDRAQDCSPYAPNSRLFLNILYIDVGALPEFVDDGGFSKPAAVLRASALVDYPGVAALKREALQRAYNNFGKADRARREDFEKFRAEHSEALLRFACFEALRAKFPGKAWRDWPAPWNSPDRAALEKFRTDNRAAVEFHEYCQWNADRQLGDCAKAARDAGMGVGLYIDLAVGIDPNGADAWSRQNSVLNGVTVGAPPDEFNPAGQDWGLAPFNPQALAENDTAMRELLRAVMRHAGAIRIDHVLGLNRIFMIPRGMGAKDGAYVRFPFEALLRVVAEESNKARCVVIGEDLGTVPDGFRDTLARYGIWVYRVMLFEREQDGRFRPPQSYPAEALATFGTHDMATVPGWMSGHDLEVKAKLGIDPGESAEARQKSRDALRGFIAEHGGERGDDVAAIASLLAKTPSRLVAVSIEDVLGVADQVNIPGTVDQHPNWRRKLPVAVDQLTGNTELRKIGAVFAQAGRASRG